MASRPDYHIGIDIGGTFTDVVLRHDSGAVTSRKVLSTTDDYSRGIADGISMLLEELDIEPGSVARVAHATTVAANAILERKGALTGLVTTAGFRDVLEMRRLRIPRLYDLQYEKPSPLVSRRLRLEVKERIGAHGEVRIPLVEADVGVAARSLADQGVEAVAIGLLHAYANPEHERAAERVLRRELGETVFICCASEIVPEIREYERISTAVVNAYVGPVVQRYLEALRRRLDAIGLCCPIAIMHSGGGIVPFAFARRRPAYLVESGPAAGVIGSARVAAAIDLQSIISFDMGGTTAKAAMIEGGTPARTGEYEVGAGINLSSKLVKGGGYPIKLPFLDVSEIGAGGGSLIRVDRQGRLTVGPESAGAQPGPVCYGLGGKVPTLTDALVVLGYINPEHIAGEMLHLDHAAAEFALQREVAAPLGRSTRDVALGALAVAVATMTRAVKAVSTYRGRDPREFALLAFGGNGPVVACEIARSLGMRRVLVPPAAGVFSALGLLYSDIEIEYSRSVMLRLDRLDEAQLKALYESLETEALDGMRADGNALAAVALRPLAELRYTGQAYELTVALSEGAISVDALREGFHKEHERTYGHRAASDPVELVTIKIIARVTAGAAPGQSRLLPRTTAGHSRQVYFGPELGVRDTPVLKRGDLTMTARRGPLVIDEYDATCVVPPDFAAKLDDFGNIDIEYADLYVSDRPQ
jgi:N-methylhydantoinase A